MSIIIKNREIVLQDRAQITANINSTQKTVDVFWYLEKVDRNVYPYDENNVVDYILGVYSHINDYDTASPYPMDKMQFFLIHQKNFKYYPDPENIKVIVNLKNVLTNDLIYNTTYNNSTRYAGNHTFNKIASLSNKSEYEKFNGIPESKYQDIIDILGAERCNSVCVDTALIQTEIGSNDSLSKTCYLYDDAKQVVLRLLYPDGVDVVVPVDIYTDLNGTIDVASTAITIDINGEISCSTLVTPVDINGTIDVASTAITIDINGTVNCAKSVTPVDINGTINCAKSVTPVDINGTVDVGSEAITSDINGTIICEKAITPVDINGTVNCAKSVTPVDINGTINCAKSVTPVDINGITTIALKNSYYWNDPLNNKMGIDIDGEFNIDPIPPTELRYNLTGKVGVTDKDNLQTNLKYYSRDNVPNYQTITEYPITNLNEAKMIAEYNDNVDASFVFYYCNALASLNISDLDTSKVTNMRGMFGHCNNLTTLDVSNWDTSNVTDMTYVFNFCLKLTTIGDISNWNTSKVIDMNNMFNGCNALTTLDVSNWDTSKVTNMENMFSGCDKLANLILNFDMRSITATNKVQYMFYGCTITTGNIRFYNVRKSVFTDRATFISAIYGSGISDSILTVEFIDDTRSLVDYSKNYISNYKNITSYPTENLNEIKGLLKFNDNINAYRTFYDCTALTTLDVSDFDTSNVTSMSNMFRGCAALTTLNVSNWDTSNVTSMYYMFRGCTSLTNLTLNFDMSSITETLSVAYMFNNCTITTGNIRFYNVRKSVFTDRATFISAIYGSGISDSILTVEFIDDSQLVYYSRDNVTNYTIITEYPQENINDIKMKLDNSDFTLSSKNSFNNCRSLTTLDLSNWDTSKIFNMNDMFYGCKALTTLNVSNWDTSNVVNMGQMFYNCNSLANLTLNFDMSSITSADAVDGMFSSYGDDGSVNITSGSIRFYNVRRSVFNETAGDPNRSYSGYEGDELYKAIFKYRIFKNCGRNDYSGTISNSILTVEFID